jgi:hypothetical protein
MGLSHSGTLSQSEEQSLNLPFKLKVQGSSPVRLTRNNQ